MLRKIRYGIEAIFICFVMVFFGLLPLDVASGLAGMLGRLLGPLSSAQRTARGNLEKALPELNAQQRQRILGDMWENMGRVIGEYPHLSRLTLGRRITVEGREYFNHLRESGKAAILVSGHFANWEIAPLTGALCGMPLVVVYRAANNPVAEWFIRRIRKSYSLRQYPKSRAGAMEMVRAIKQHEPLAMLIDQKQNDGKPVSFFGRPAMTTLSAAQLAIKYQVPLYLARSVRTDGAHFHVSLDPPIYLPPDADPQEAMEAIHRVFERWIREHPAQWLWAHKRWGKEE